MADQSKRFWERPEGIFALVMAALILGGLSLAFLYFVMPIISTILASALYSLVLALGIGVLTLPIWNARARTVLWVYYTSACRAALGAVIELDPIGILRERAKDAREREGRFQEQLDNLAGHVNATKKIIAKNKHDAEEALGMAKAAAGKAGMQTAFTLQTRKYEQLNESNQKLQEVVDRMSSVLAILKRMKEMTGALAADIEQTVEIQSQQRKALLAGYGAYKEAKGLLAGEGSEREMFDLAMEKLADDYSLKMATIENFAESSKGLIQSFDLKDEAAQQQMLARIADLEQHGLAIEANPATRTRVAAGEPDTFDDLLSGPNTRGAARHDHR
jgi:hypothetical protein